MSSIVITFTPEGPVVEADGFKGPACEQLLDELLEGTGLIAGSHERKPEYQQTETQSALQG